MLRPIRAIQQKLPIHGEIWKWAFFATLYVSCVQMGIILTDNPEHYPVVWPASAVALAGILLTPPRYRKRYTGIFFLLSITPRLWNGMGWVASFGFSLADSLEWLLGAWVIEKLSGENFRFNRPQAVGVLFFVAVVVNGVISILRTGISISLSGTSFYHTWVTWWISNGIALLIIPPFFITWFTKGFRHFKPRRILEGITFLAVLGVISWVAIGPDVILENELFLNFLVYPILIWSAFRLGLRGTSTLLVLFSITALGFTLQGQGEYALAGRDTLENVLLVDNLLGITTLLALLLATSVVYRDEAAADLQRSITQLESLHLMSQEIIATLDIEHICSAAHHAVEQLIPTDAFFITLLDEDGLGIQDLYLFDRGQRWPNEHAMLSEQGLIASVIHNGETILIEDDLNGISARMGISLFGSPEDTRSVLIAPLKIKNQVIGAISAQHYKPGKYTREHVQFLSTLASQIAISIEHARLVQSLRPQSIALETAANAIVITDNQGNILWANPAFTSLTGYTVAEAVGKNPRELLRSGEHSRDFYQELWDTILAGRVWHGDMINRRKNGELYFEEMTITPLLDENDQISQFIAIKQDVTERKQAERLARESEARYRSLFEQSHDAVFILDTNDQILSANQRAADMLGYTSEELVTLSVADISYEVEESDQVREKLLRGEHVPFYERRFRKKDGGTVLTEINVELVKDDQGNLLHIQSVVRDITERKRAEVSLRESETRYRSLFEQSHDAVFILDLQGRHITANHRAADMLGYTVEEIQTLSFRDTSSEPEASGQIMERLLRGEHVPLYERKFKKKDGEIVHTEINVELVRDDQGHPLHILSVVRDITKRKLAEEAIRASNETLSAVFNVSPLAVILLDMNGMIQLWNPAAERIFGWTREEVIGQPNPIVPAEKDDEYHRLQDHVRAGGTISEQEVERQRKDGSQIHISLSSAPLFDADGHPRAIMAIVADITERKRVEESIRMKTDELEVLFSISTHLRTAQTADDMLPLVLSELRRVMVMDASAVILHSATDDSFTYALGDGILASNIGTQFSVENSISGLVLKTHQAYTTEDISSDTRRAAAINGADNLGPTALVPIQSDAEFIGILVCARQKDSGASPFSPSEVQLLTAIGEMVGNALRRARLYDQAISRLQHVQALHSVDMAISANLDLNITLEILLGQVTAQLNVDAADILLLDPYSYVLEFAAGHGFQNKPSHASTVRIGDGLAGWVALNRKILTVPNLALSDRLARKNLVDEGMVYYYGVPLISKGNLLGVLEIFSRSSTPVTAEQLDYLEALAIQAAIAIDNAKLFGELQNSNVELLMAYDATIEGWSRALELRDEETEGHTLRVTEMTVMIAKVMGINEKEFSHIRHGALLHDIGKMGIPDKILLKPGQLDKEEWEIMKMHPVYAFEMLWPITFLRPAIDIPHCHHEKWDGTGYPRRLKGENIPLAARVFAIADVYDALTSDRPYRKAWDKDNAVEYILGQSGKHFQPEVVEAFVKLIANGNTLIK